MDIEKRLEFLNTEKTKILGFARSHLRNVELARRFEAELDRKIRKLKTDRSTPQAFHQYLWKEVREQCYDWLRKEHYQFRVFDDGTIELLDQAFMKRPGGILGEQIRQTGETLACFPERARAVLQLHYQKGLSCEEISKRIKVPVDEVYQLWRHAIIFLWEGIRGGEGQGFQEKEDEDFWTLGLRYLDGTASEKFVAELNSEIHVSQSRMKEYNDLRIIDGIMIAFGATDQWPRSELVEAVGSEPPVSVEPRKKKEKKTKPPREKKDRVIAAKISTIGTATIPATRNLLETGFDIFKGALEPPQETKASPERESGRGESKPTLKSMLVPPDEADRRERPVIDPGAGKELLGNGWGKLKKAFASGSEPGNKSKEGVILGKGDPDDGVRRGVHLDESPGARKMVPARINPLLRKQLIVLAEVGLGVILLSVIFSKAGEFLSIGSGGSSRILRATPIEFSKGTTRGGKIKSGYYEMSSGTMHFHTPQGIGVIIEAPARFLIKSSRHIFLKEGRLVALVPGSSSPGVKLDTDRFELTSAGGEIGILVDDESSEVIVFSGEGKLGRDDKEIAPGTGLRFSEAGDPERIESRTEAYRYPDVIPVTGPRAYGDNLVVNQGFEVGTMSRGCRIERLYRDVPSGWTAGLQKDGVSSAALEQHSGTVRLTGSIGGLPAPVHGERYLWINHGFVSQELPELRPGVTYTLSVQVASHPGMGAGSSMFRFGIRSGSEWISQSAGQLRSGQPFREMKLEFELPRNGTPGTRPILMLTGETGIFYDNVVLREKE